MAGEWEEESPLVGGRIPSSGRTWCALACLPMPLINVGPLPKLFTLP